MRQGSVLAGRFAIEALVGRGGMGEVWRATDTRLGRQVAVKVLRADDAVPDDLAERFRREATVAARLQHPGITTVHDFGSDGPDLFLVMEFLTGTTLARTLRAHPDGLPVGQAVDLARQLAGALATAHQGGVVHRDLKPANIMLLPDGTAKICDFGIATFALSATAQRSLTATGMSVGTPLYMAPEQILAQRADARTDLYALGCVLYEMLTGRPPFDVDARVVAYHHLNETPAPPGTHRPGLPPELDTLVRQLLAKHREQRPRDATAVADRLDIVTPGRRTAVPTSTRTDVPGRVAVNGPPASAARSRPVAVPLLLSLLAALGVFAWADSALDVDGKNTEDTLNSLAVFTVVWSLATGAVAAAVHRRSRR